MSELMCHERMTALRAGMASVIPIQMLPVLSAMDADVRICGLPEINLDFLMVGIGFCCSVVSSCFIFIISVSQLWT